jgi:COP9 signalosome complex subunit 1
MEDWVETIVTRYVGECRLQRLRWIMVKTSAATGNPSDPLTHAQQQLLRTAAAMAIQKSCQAEGNLHRYKELFEVLLGGGTISGVAHDPQWFQEQQGLQKQNRAVLRHRLQAVQAHLHKEAIKAAYLALADHAIHCGDLVEAFHSVLRAKDYCTSRQHTTSVCLQIVELGILLGNASAKEYLVRLDHTIGNDTPAYYRLQIQITTGLERLLAGDYPAAAKHWSAVVKQGVVDPGETAVFAGGTASPSSSNSTAFRQSALLAPEDIALYAAFLALGCSPGSDMVALAEHPEALELVPNLREALVLFGRRCDYRSAWEILEKSVFPLLAYDLYMAPHLAALQTMIREKAVASYWKAYDRVGLAVMADELGTGLVPSVDALREQLVSLIRRGVVQDSRIDLQTMTIHRDPPPPKDVQVRAKLDVVTRRTLDDTYSTLTRLACLEHDLVVADGNNARRRGGRARGAGVGGIIDVAMNDDGDDDGPGSDMEIIGDAMNPEDLY